MNVEVVLDAHATIGEFPPGLQLNRRYTGSISGSQRFTDTILATKLAELDSE